MVFVFLLDDCDIVTAQKNRLLVRKDEEIVRRRAMLAPKDGKLVTLEVYLATAGHAMSAITAERDEVGVHVGTVARGVEKALAGYNDKIPPLAVLSTNSEANAGALETLV